MAYSDKLFICVMTLRKWMGVELFASLARRMMAGECKLESNQRRLLLYFLSRPELSFNFTSRPSEADRGARGPGTSTSLRITKFHLQLKLGVYWNPKHSITITSKGQLGNGDFTFSALSAKKVIKNAYKRTIIENSLTIGTFV